jgi:hypothetical protein
MVTPQSSSSSSFNNTTSSILETLIRDLDETQMDQFVPNAQPPHTPPPISSTVSAVINENEKKIVGEDVPNSMKQQPRAPCKRLPIKRKRTNFDEGTNAEFQSASSRATSSSSSTSSDVSLTKPAVGNFEEILESLIHFIKCLIIFLR